MRRLVILAATLVAVACSKGSGPTIKLDGSPHRATDAGIITAADRHEVVVDGKRHYSVNPHLVVFTPGTLQLAPLALTIGRYALLGAKGSRVDWIEPLTVVARLPGGPPTVFYFATLARIDGTSAIFADGTVLGLGPGVGPPPSMSLPARVRADIDPVSHAVRALSPA